MGVENINFIANYLLAKGANKNAVIGVLVNMGVESTWNVYNDEKPSMGNTFYYNGQGTSHGYGLVQYSWLPLARELYDYCHAVHTEQECIKNELDTLWNEKGLTSSQGASWLDVKGYGVPKISDYWTNSKGFTAEQCCTVFRDCFERGWLTGSQRWNHPTGGWNVVKNYVDQWDGNVPDLGGDIAGSSTGDTEETPQQEKVRNLTLQECLAFLDRLRPANNSGNTGDPLETTPETPTPQPSSGGQARVDALRQEGLNAGLQYSQTRRLDWPHYADCSSFVSRCVSVYLNVDYNGYVNTDTLHDYIIGLGWKKVYEGSKWNMPLDSQEADIIITGVKAQSGGNAGHTLWVCDTAGTTYECTAIPANGQYGDGNILCKSTLQAQRDVWLTSSSYWYKYRRA